MSKVTNSIGLRGEPAAIFDLVTTARYWPQWHPATVGVSGQIDNPMRFGDVIRERALIGGMEAENDWTVTRLERPHLIVLSMPKTRLGDLLISYTFEPREGGVEFVRELEYDASGFTPELQSRIEQQMHSDSAEALRRIKGFVEQSAKAE